MSQNIPCGGSRVFSSWLRSTLFAIAPFFFLEEGKTQAPAKLTFTGQNGSYWNLTDLNWNGNQAWIPNSGAEFSGSFNGREIRMAENITATYLYFAGQDHTAPSREYTIWGEGNRLDVYQILFTRVINPVGGSTVPVATFRDVDLIVGGGGIGNGAFRDTQFSIYDYSDDISGHTAGGTLHFRGASRVLSAVGIHTEAREVYGNDSLPTDAVLHFHDTSVFESLGVHGGTFHFNNSSSMVLPFERFAVKATAMFFNHDSVLDIRTATDTELGIAAIQQGAFIFADDSVMKADTAAAVGREFIYSQEPLSFEFRNRSQLNITKSDSIRGGDFTFNGTATLLVDVTGEFQDASITQSGTTFTFSGASTMEVEQGRVRGGYFEFNGSSTLNIQEGSQVASHALFHFNDQSVVNIFAEDGFQGLRANQFTVERRFQFTDSSVLNAEASRAVNDIKMHFEGDSVLNANVRHAVWSPGTNPGGDLSFAGNSVLNATALESVSGYSLSFAGNSTLNALSMFALQETTLTFSGAATLNAGTTAAVNTGTHTFTDQAQLNALAHRAVAGTDLSFTGQSSLNIGATEGLYESEASFNGESTLHANATGALGDADTTLTFRDSSSLQINAGAGLSDGTQTFRDESSLQINEWAAITGGTQTFREDSMLEVSAGQGVMGGTQVFLNQSSLVGDHSWAMEGGTQSFYNTSTFHANYSSSVNGGNQLFYNDSSLHLAQKALADGSQTFYDNAVLYATRSESVFGGQQEFYGESILLASEEDALAGGTQLFYGSSSLNAHHADAIAGGTQVFFANSQLNARAHSTRSANELTFFGNSALNAQTSQAIINGSQVFNDSSTLNVEAGYGVMGGTQTFYKTSELHANATNALRDSQQIFHEGSALHLNASEALSGNRLYTGDNPETVDRWRVNFLDSSSLNINTSQGVATSVPIVMSDNSSLKAYASHSITGFSALSPAQIYATLFFDPASLEINEVYLNATSSLHLQAAQAMSGGVVLGAGEAAIHISASNGFSGGHIFAIPDAGITMNASASSAISGGYIQMDGQSLLNVAAGTGIAAGFQIFYDQSRLQIQHASAIGGGIQRFWDNTSLDVLTPNGLGGGTQEFLESSTLNAGVADSISGGTQRFYGQATLQAEAIRAVKGGEQTFIDNSALNAANSSAIAGGTQHFYDQSSLNASVANAVIGGTQNFHDSSRLNASMDWSVLNGQQNFYETSALFATEFSAVRGGTQNFHDQSFLQLKAGQALMNGTQNFYDSSRLQADLTLFDGVGGGTQNFYEQSSFTTSGRRTVIGGAQNFYDDSSLIPQGASAINGGTQTFYDSSTLEIYGVFASGVITNGTQDFYGTSGLIAGKRNSITGGVQTFRDKSVLYASELESVNGVEIRLHHESRLEVGVTNALHANTSVSFHQIGINGPGGTFRLSGHNVTVGSLRSAVAGSGLIENQDLETATLTVSFNTPQVEFSGHIRDGEEGDGALSIIKSGTGTWLLSSANAWSGGLNIQSGSIRAAHDSALGTGSVSITAQGTLATEGKREIYNHITNQGMVAGDSNGELLSLYGDITGAGGYSGNILMAGSYSPGNSAALIQVNGDLSFGALHTLAMEIGGTTRGTEYDAFNVTGALQLGGHLQVAFLNSYEPLLPEGFTLFTAGTLSGSFSSYDFSQAVLSNPKLAWDLSDLNTSGKLWVTANPFYGQENPDGTLHIVRTEDGQWAANGASDYSGEVVVDGDTLRVDNDQALGTGGVSIGEDGRLETTEQRTLANDIVNQGVVAGPGAEGDEWMRLEGDVSGAGSYEGNIEFAGSFSPGNSPALIEAEGNLTFAEMHTLILEIGGLERGTEYDAFDVSGTLTLGGSFVLSLLDDFVPLAGQSFLLFQAGNLEGMFTSYDFSLAGLGQGLYWDTSHLSSHGILSVGVIPEPSAWMLLLGALAMILRFKRRQKQRAL